MFFQYFYQALEQNWDNLNVIFVTWDTFLHTGLTEFHMFFKTKYTAFFSCLCNFQAGIVGGNKRRYILKQTWRS